MKMIEYNTYDKFLIFFFTKLITYFKIFEYKKNTLYILFDY
jgi:hypothetical protein